MGKLCYVCRRFSEKFSKRSYHRFPTDQLERLKWFKLLGMEPVFTRNIFLCSDHFEPDCFRIEPRGRRVLRKNTLPKKLPSEISASESESESTTESDTDTTTTSETETAESRCKEEPPDSAETIILKVEPEAETTLIQVPFPKAPSSSSATLSATESVMDYNGELINELNDPLDESMEVNTIKEPINDPLEEGQEANQQVLVKRETLSPVPGATVSSTTESETKPYIIQTVEHVPEATQITKESVTNESYELRKAKRQLETVNKTIQFKNKKIKTLQQQNRRLRARVSCLQSLLRYLEANNLIKDNTTLDENGQAHESCSKIISRFLKEP